MTRDDKIQNWRRTVSVVCFRHGGTHLIFPLARRLNRGVGINDVLKRRRQLVYRNNAWRFIPPEGRKIICWRDPRNLIVSKIRHTRKRKRLNIAVEKSKAVRKFLWEDRVVYPDASGIGHIEQLLRTARRWEPVEGLRVPFEVLTDPETGPAAADEIAEYLRSSGGAEWYRQIYGHGKTYNSEKSDWRDWFCEESLAAFKAKGGEELVELLGYQWETPNQFRGHEIYLAADDNG